MLIYLSVCPSVHSSVRLSVRPSVHPSIHPSCLNCLPRTSRGCRRRCVHKAKAPIKVKEVRNRDVNPEQHTQNCLHPPHTPQPMKQKLDLHPTGEESGVKGSPHYPSIGKPLPTALVSVEGLTPTSCEGALPAEVRRRPANMWKEVVTSQTAPHSIFIGGRDGEKEPKSFTHQIIIL